MRLPLFAGQVLPDCRQHQLGVLFWPARTIGRRFIVPKHCSIRKLGDQPAPALFPGLQGLMTDDRSHNSVTVATTPEHPGWPC